MDWFEIPRTLGTYIPWLPVLVCGFLTARGRKVPGMAWCLTGAFFISYLFDLIGDYYQNRGQVNQWLTYIYAPIQFGALVAIISPSIRKPVVWFGFFLACVLSWTSFEYDVPERIVQALAGAWVSLVVLTHRTAQPYRVPVLIYCLFAVPLLIAMGTVPIRDPAWLWVWGSYIAVRVVALGWLARVTVVQSAPMLEVRDGLGIDRAAGKAGSERRRGGLHFRRPLPVQARKAGGI